MGCKHIEPRFVACRLGLFGPQALFVILDQNSSTFVSETLGPPGRKVRRNKPRVPFVVHVGGILQPIWWQDVDLEAARCKYAPDLEWQATPTHPKQGAPSVGVRRPRAR